MIRPNHFSGEKSKNSLSQNLKDVNHLYAFIFFLLLPKQKEIMCRFSLTLMSNLLLSYIFLRVMDKLTRLLIKDQTRLISLKEGFCTVLKHFWTAFKLFYQHIKILFCILDTLTVLNFLFWSIQSTILNPAL